MKNYFLGFNEVWSIINGKRDFNVPHRHGNSILSLAYYVKFPENGGDIYFVDPRVAGIPRKPVLNKEFLEELWPTIKSAINFSVNLQTSNGTIPWSIDINGEIEKDYLLTGSSSILKSIECGIAIAKILGDHDVIEGWSKSYEGLAYAIKNPKNKFDLTHS